MELDEVKRIIENTGIFPGIRVDSADQALYAAETLFDAGIPVAEITMTVPEAVEVIRALVQKFPTMAVGAGTVLDTETARRCIDAGARFVTSTGLVSEVVDAVRKAKIVAIPGALTPSEVIAGWKMGADYVKIFPAASLGGDLYIRSLKLPLPYVKIIAAGGVNQQTAVDFLRAGSTAIGVGMELLPREAVARRQSHRIHELARRFLGYVKEARKAS
ncbi:MAG: bifunctional 4-hydroxy-2-oxoglutarate aldolase/2-dehydro-3-deoxy-phosphogluconate aldolase [Terracidiphilus sp.]|jgi:2-dehydro-3-deoxyphosphogluconate aldolase/(4S)-4-hydroxy-2-oxoglutarate aldolase